LNISCGTLLKPLEEKNGADLIIENAKVANIIRSRGRFGSSDLIDASRYHVVSWFIDLHTHIRAYRLDSVNGEDGLELTDQLTPRLNVLERLDTKYKDTVVYGEDLLSMKSKVQIVIDGKIVYRHF